MASNILNFDEVALKATRHRIEKAGRGWDVRDDLPSSVWLDMFLFALGGKDLSQRYNAAQQRMQEAVQGGATVGPSDLEAALRDEYAGYAHDMLALCHAIFAHSYPEIEATEIAAVFSTDEQRAIVDHFFTLRSAGLIAALSATADSSVVEAETETTTTTAADPAPTATLASPQPSAPTPHNSAASGSPRQARAAKRNRVYP